MCLNKFNYMKEEESKANQFITKRLSERRDGHKESIAQNRALKKSASAFIVRRMGGVYEKDRELRDALVTGVSDLFDPNTENHKI